MHKKGFIFIIALLFWPCLTQAELVQDERAILDRVDRIERDLTLLQRKIYKQDVQDASSVTQAPMGSVQHLYTKVADVEQIAADLTNQFEELKHQQKLLTERIDRMNADMDIRLTDLEKGQQRLSKEEKKSSQDEMINMLLQRQDMIMMMLSNQINQLKNNQIQEKKIIGKNSSYAKYQLKYWWYSILHSLKLGKKYKQKKEKNKMLLKELKRLEKGK